MLPHFGKVQKWIKAKEQEAREEFGVELTLRFTDANFQLGIDAVSKLVSDVLSVPINKILSTSREEEEKEARQIIMYLCKMHISELKPGELAAYFNKDRTTILHSYARIEDLLKAADASMIEKMKNCQNELLKRITE